MAMLGVILLFLGSFIFVYPFISSEAKRQNYVVKPTGKRDDKEIIQVVGSMLKPIFWTNRKLFIAGALVEILGLIILVFY
jgi:hypothetical protein